MLSLKKNVILSSILICIILMTQNSYSGVPKEMVADASIDSVQILQDSLYAKINRSFQSVKPMLEYSCFDCHSSNTNEPWYFNIPGVNSLLTSHVADGRKHLDCTDGFPFKTKESLLGILHEIKEEVEEGEMPLLSYRIMHWGHLIEDEKQDSLFLWIDETIASLNQFNKFHNIKIEVEEKEKEEH